MKKLRQYTILMILSWVLFCGVPWVSLTATGGNLTAPLLWLNRIAVPLLLAAAVWRTVRYHRLKKQLRDENVSEDGHSPVQPPTLSRSAAKDALMTYSDRITERMPENLLDFDTFKAFFERLQITLKAAWPLVTATGNPFDTADKSKEHTRRLIVQAMTKLNRTLQVLAVDKAAAEWEQCGLNDLTDTFILLDYYCSTVPADSCQHIAVYRDLLATHLLKRYEADGTSADESEMQRKELSEAEGMALLRSLDTVYVMYAASTGPDYPSVDMRGYAWVFTEKAYADYIREQSGAYGLCVREMSLPAFTAFAADCWYACGVYRFKLNPGINDVYAEITRDHFVPNPDAKMFDYYGSNLNQLILRFKQMRANAHDADCVAFSQTLWSSICHQLYKTVFLVPIAYDNEPDDAADHCIHYSAAAVKAVNALEVEIALGSEAAQKVDVQTDGILANEKHILGAEGYRFAAPENTVGGRVMHLRSLTNGDSSVLCGFTDIRDIHRIFGKNLHIALMTYEDIISHMDDKLSDGKPLVGFVINPGANELLLSREHIALAEKESKEPVKLYINREK